MPRLIPRSFVDLNTISVLVCVLFVLMGIITFLFYKKYSEVTNEIKDIKSGFVAFEGLIKMAMQHTRKAPVCKIPTPVTPPSSPISVEKKTVTFAPKVVVAEEIPPFTPVPEKKVVEEIVTELDLNDLLEKEMSKSSTPSLGMIEEEIKVEDLKCDEESEIDDFDFGLELIKEDKVVKEKKAVPIPEL